MTTPLHFQSASELVPQLVRGTLKSWDLLEHLLARIEQHNPTLNAVIWMDVEGARAQADAADAAAARGQIWGPLHGIPMTIKESYRVAGSPTTWGSPDFKNNVTDEDALAVQRLKTAGAIIFGKCNVPLMLADYQSYNDNYGTTNNPWDTSRTPGGSSGGSAAALAAGLTSLDAGSDIGSSIRNPAHYCGVFGHKPTYGVLSPEGHSLPGANVGADISVIGPLARSAADLELAMRVMSGLSPMDAGAFSVNLPASRHRRLSEFRVALKLGDPLTDTDIAYQDNLQRLADSLSKAGATVVEAEPEVDTARLHELYVLLLRAATSGRQTDEVMDESRRVAAQPDDGSYVWQMAKGNTLSHREWLALNNERHGIRRAFAAFFQNYDILLCPVAAGPAFPHDQEGLRHNRTIAVNNKIVPTTDQLFWAGYPGLTFLPATVGPVGLVADLPVGYQAITGHGMDYTSIEFAKLVEQEIMGFTPPPGY